jgi:hypothetical protein
MGEACVKFHVAYKSLPHIQPLVNVFLRLGKAGLDGIDGGIEKKAGDWKANVCLPRKTEFEASIANFKRSFFC